MEASRKEFLSLLAYLPIPWSLVSRHSSISTDSSFWLHAIIDLTILNYMEQCQFCKVGLRTVRKPGMVLHQYSHWSCCQEQTQSMDACWKHQGQGTEPYNVEMHPSNLPDKAVDNDVLP